jgi:hypothetical protein
MCALIITMFGTAINIVAVIDYYRKKEFSWLAFHIICVISGIIYFINYRP